MSLIVAARFDTFPDVENAAQRLFSEGFTKQDVHVFYVNSAGEHSRYAYGGDRRSDPDSGRADMGAILGAALFGLAFAIAGGFIVAGLNESTIAMLAAAGVGAYIGSLFGALWVTGHLARKRGEAAPVDHPEVRPAGLLLALHTDLTRETLACQVLRAANGHDVEHAEGVWRDNRWQDFDPLKPPQREP
ncbi:hypothetical protein AZ16_0337 [Bordetella bronchiseptica B18-5 (C3)]|uniref:hypothetical protein n=1 Tax=Bordetella bronchiseptica TaxID=518 RepID=UPI000461A459|nr:hypothetical protein [Bordetella bronchiseptica]KDB62880.1 hypothetical protein AZ16_0337 [Bordetella bronchiseptica B18-5 (C3)]KDD90697.1 hypothetical protein L524_2031 [Bordetella bronchiseptica MBORD762]